MTKNLFILNGIIIFYIIQRLSEVLISKENEVWLKKHCNAVEVNPREGLRMKIFHTLWFISLLLEANIKREFSSNWMSLGIYIILGLCLGVRIYSMEKLKKFWTIKIFSLDNQVIVTDGLYKYIRHPNYLVVIIELIFLPLLFKAYYTLVIFSFLNLFILKKRIELEEETIMAKTKYEEHFKHIKRIAPFFTILFFLGLNSLQAEELNYQFIDYNEAKKSENFIKFEGQSTKFGLITTTFNGYAKEFKVHYNLSNNQLNELDVKIAVKGLDTDISSRDDKMLNSILDMSSYPEIQARIQEKVILTEGGQVVYMVFSVKGKKVTKAVKISIEKKADKFSITGNTVLGLHELGLPDPSIVIAKVDENFDLSFAIML
jgi:methyltransferase